MAASRTMPVVPPNRRGIAGQWLALAGAAIAIAVIVALIVTWPDHGGNSGSAAGPTPAAKQAGKFPARDAAAFKP